MKSRKIKKKPRKFRTNRIIIFMWRRRLGRIKEAIYIYEDLIDIWEN